jgi:hypothetical protein
MLHLQSLSSALCSQANFINAKLSAPERKPIVKRMFYNIAFLLAIISHLFYAPQNGLGIVFGASSNFESNLVQNAVLGNFW